MGTVEIVNPENKRAYEIPIISLHALAHGSFAYDGTEHVNSRLDAVNLVRTMKTHALHIANDQDNDGLTDEEEHYFGFDAVKADSDNNGIHDSKELARQFADSIKALPTVPSTTEPYAQWLGMDGIQLCSVCGKEVVMGVVHIYNPLLNTIDPYEIRYYALHFLEQGSFSCEGAQTSRIDPVALSQYLNLKPTDIHPAHRPTVPGTFVLDQNYPNPFNAATAIGYRLPAVSPVELTIYNLLGQKIETLVKERQQAGHHQVNWDASGFPGGIYYYRIVAGEFQQVRKMILLK
jgi:hypothetical protein